MRILITGGTGFIGQHLVTALEGEGHNLRLLVRESKVEPSSNQEEWVGDLMSPESLQGIASDIEMVIHTAALTNVRDPKTEGGKFHLVNVVGTENLLKVCGDIKYFLHFSSVDALGPHQGIVVSEDHSPQPRHPYDFSKLESEKLVREYSKKFGYEFTILRPGMVYGEGESNPRLLKVNSAILTFSRLMQKHLFPVFGSGKNHLPLVHVKDIVQAVLLCMGNQGSRGQVYQVCSESCPTMNELVAVMARELQVSFPGPRIPISLARTLAWGASVFEKSTGISLGISRSSVDYLTQDRRYSIDKIKSDLAYKPMRLEDGIHETLNWYREKGKL